MRRWGPQYNRTHKMYAEQRRAMSAISTCRTAMLGGHLEACDGCGAERPVYNSCGDRHCPMCGGIRMRKWLCGQLDDLLPVPYFHTVFTLPNTFDELIPRNERAIYDMLFRAASGTLKAVARQQWQAEPGIIMVLHTWGQTMSLHPHAHCIVTGGGLSLDRKRWVKGPGGSDYLFDVFACSAEFRKRFCRLMRWRYEHLTFADDSPFADHDAYLEFLATEEARDWVVYTQPPAGGEVKVLSYLSRYTHRLAISNRRIVGVSDDGMVTLDYKDYRDVDESGIPMHKEMALPADTFIGRFLRHVLPKGFRRIRCCGILAGRHKQAKLARCRELLAAEEPDGEALLESLALPDDAHCCEQCGHTHFTVIKELLPGRGPPVQQIAGRKHAA